MVDCGAQSTIMSRKFLHYVVKEMLQRGEERPKLERAMVQLFGKDGPQGGQELVITAQVELTQEACGKQARVPVLILYSLIAPNSCYLGLMLVWHWDFSSWMHMVGHCRLPPLTMLMLLVP